MFNFSLKRYLVRYLSLTLILFLTGCSTLTNVDWPQHEQKLTQLTNFIAKGKIGYKDPQHNQSLSFALTQKNDHSELRLLTPFGQTAMKLTMTPTSTTLNVDGKDYYGQEANQLVYELTGLNVPVSQLPDWIKGLPTQADHVEYSKYNAVSRIEKRLNGSMWVLQYNEYMKTDREGFILPKSMLLQQNNTVINLELRAWELTERDLNDEE